MPRRRASKENPPTWTPNQVVAANLNRLRLRRGMTQAEAAMHLSSFSGKDWTEAMVAHAERSVTGNRIREFTADDLVTMARAFNVPVLYFLTPPPRIFIAVADEPRHGITTEEMFRTVLGRLDNLAEWEAILDEWDFNENDEVPFPLSEERRKALKASAQEVALVRAHHLIRSHFKGDLNQLQDTLFNLAGLVNSVNNREVLADLDEDEYIKRIEAARQVTEKGLRLACAQKNHEAALEELYRQDAHAAAWQEARDSES